MPIATTAVPTARDLLARQREILSDPARWTSGATARRPDGTPCSSCDPSATCFCAVAALDRAYQQCFPPPPARGQVRRGAEAFVVAYELLNHQAERLHARTLIGVNEDLGHEAVLGVIDAALAAAHVPALRRRRWPRLLCGVAPWLRPVWVLGCTRDRR